MLQIIEYFEGEKDRSHGAEAIEHPPAPKPGYFDQ